MKNCYILYPHSLKIFYILKHLEKRGFNIKGIRIYDSQYLLKTNKKILTYFIAKQMTNKELDDLENVQWILLKTRTKIKNNFYLQNIDIVSIEDFKLKEGDKVFSFDERFLFEASILDKNFISPSKALVYSCKHMIYKRIDREFIKIKSVKDFDSIPNGKFILKPSVESIGKRNVFVINSKDDIKPILEKDPEIFSLNRIFILEKYIEHVSEIWAMTLFDAEGNPYILWYSTEKNHATFSPFQKDLYDKINEINKKLKINSWMAYMQFLLDEFGNLHFVDLNPRLPGDDDWHELIYRYMTGRSFAKAIVDLIIDNKAPDIIKTNKYVIEEEYSFSQPLQKNQKMWDYSDNYKQKPLLTFKKLDLK